MRPYHSRRIDAIDDAIVATLDDGATLGVRLLEPTLARVTLKPATSFKEPRTWAIAPMFNGTRQDVPWEGRARESLDGFSMPRVQTKVNATNATLTSEALHITLEGNPLRLVWRTPSSLSLGERARVRVGADSDSSQTKTDWPITLEDRATSSYLRESRSGLIRHYLKRDPRDRYYGLGDKTGPLNLHGRRLRTTGMDSLGFDPEHGDPLYKHWPFVMSRTPSGQWVGLYYDTLAGCTFDLGAEHDNYHDLYRFVEIDDGDLDYYAMFGNTPGDVVAQFMQLIGGTHLPPRWTLGYAQTAMGLADAPDAQHQLDRFIDRCQSEGVPIKAFHYGSGYSSRGKRRYVFTWNTAKFPDPKALNAKFHAAGMNIVANLKPCLLDDHPAYAAMVKARGVLTNAQGEPIVEPFWDGLGAHLDFTNRETVAWWQRELKRKVLDYGIDVGWNDNNEYAVLDETAQSHGFGEAIPLHRSRPLHALLMTRATFEAQTERLGNVQDVFTVTRAGPPGIQRYAQTWSGDNSTSWRSLKWNIRTGLQMSLSGMFNIGHDTGGFSGPVPTPELLVRWTQATCLNPRMIMNSWKTDGTITLPWMHPEVTPHILAALRLRERLMPYLWQCFEAAAAKHEPIIRPTFFNFPDDEACYEDNDEFMLGSDVLVAPVVTVGATRRDVYLPALPNGGRWIAFDSRESFASGSRATIDAPLGRLPLFVRDSAKVEQG